MAASPAMDLLPLNPDELLSTTRAVRKRLDFDRPVPREAIVECVQLATQAPTGSNVQGWHFVVVGEPEKRLAIAELYRTAFAAYRTMPIAAGNIVTGRAERDAQQQRVMDSAEYLAANMEKAPYLVIPCVDGRSDNPLATGASMGSVMPAVWSFMLAARARGLGTCWTSLHLWFEQQAAEILGIPYESVTQICLTPVAYTKGTDFKPAKREPIDTVLHWDGW